MRCSPKEYTRHFSKYADRLFHLHHDIQMNQLSKDEHFLLKHYGLPDSGLPFLHFDLSLQYLRDIKIKACLFVLGTPIQPASSAYIYISDDHSIRIVDENNHVYFLNSSLQQLMECMYIYSTWLERIEAAFMLTNFSKVTHTDVFDLYYDLRKVDRTAFDKNQQDTLWLEIVKTDIQLPASSPELV